MSYRVAIEKFRGLARLVMARHALHDGPHVGGFPALTRLSPSGRHYDISREAFELFAAMRSVEPQEAMFRAFRLHRLARDARFPETQEAAEALEIALVCCETCDSPPVLAACAHLVRTMVLDGLIHSMAVGKVKAIEPVAISRRLSVDTKE